MAEYLVLGVSVDFEEQWAPFLVPIDWIRLQLLVDGLL